MKNFSGFIFAVTAIAFLEAGFAQQGKPTGVKITEQQYDSLAAVDAFNRDTISALENYRKCLQLNPANEGARKNYERLNYDYIKSGQSFYNINP